MPRELNNNQLYSESSALYAFNIYSAIANNKLLGADDLFPGT